jgi:predicted RNase H-like HicB family nuclease
MEDFTDDKRSPLLQFSKKEELLMLAMYPAIFCKSDNGMYSVLFPDFNCATCGDNLEDAMEMAIDCMAGHVYSMQRDEEELPVASEPSKELLEKECEYVGADPSQAFWNYVCVDVAAYAKQHFTKSVKKTLSIPQ